MNTAQEFLVPLERNQRGETKQLTVVGKQVRQRMLLDHPWAVIYPEILNPKWFCGGGNEISSID